MEICNQDHQEIVYQGIYCPLCEYIEETKQTIRELECEIDDLKEEVEELKEEAEKCKN